MTPVKIAKKVGQDPQAAHDGACRRAAAALRRGARSPRPPATSSPTASTARPAAASSRTRTSSRWPSAARARASASMSATAARRSRSRSRRWRSQRGLLPFSISTDLHARSLDSPVWDMGTTMSKLLAVGMPFEAVVEAVDAGADARRSACRRENLLAPGTPAEFTLFDVDDERSAHPRFHGRTRPVSTADRCRAGPSSGRSRSRRAATGPAQTSLQDEACPHCGWVGAR